MPDDKPIEKVSLFRCKQCKARMFWRDCKSHMERHGISTNGDLREYFARGPKNVPLRPGELWKPLHPSARKKNKKNAQANPN